MRVVYEGALFPTAGGGPQHFIGLSEGLLAQGVELVQVLPEGSGVARPAAPAERVELRASGSRTRRQLRYEFARLVLVLGWWLSGRRVDIWISRHSIFGVSLFAARLVARHVVLEVNGPVREEMLANFGNKPAARLADWLLRAQVRAAHLTVAVSPGLTNYLKARIPGSRCETLANGATASLPSSQERGGSPLLFAGALTPWYELDVTLRAMSMLRSEGHELGLRILGDGIRRQEFEDLCKDLGISDLVAFEGWVDSSTVRAAMQRARVGLLPLRPKHELLDAVGSPLKLYEYVAAGLQVVGTDVDGVSNSPVSMAVHIYERSDITSCAHAIRAAMCAPTTTGLGEQAWSWGARARELFELLDLPVTA